MAKTTSQIVKENKAIAAARDKIHQQQMADVTARNGGVTAAQKTQAVLQRALSGTTGTSAKSELKKALASVSKEAKVQSKYTEVKIEGRSDSDAKKLSNQKKKEDALAKTSVNSAQIKKDRAEKQLEDLENQDFDWTDAAARRKHEAQRERLQQEVDSAGAEMAKAEDSKAISEMSEPDRRQLERYSVSQVENQNKPVELSDPNSTLFLGLFGNKPNSVTGEDFTDLFGKVGGKARADELSETLMRDENAELNQKVAEVGQKAADDHPILSSLASIPVSAVSGVIGTVGQLQSAARATGRYPTTDPNATGTMLDAYSGNIRSKVAQNITGDIYNENGNLVEDGGVVRQALSLLYQGGMSMADSIARAYIGGGSVGGAVLAATNTFSQTMAEAAEKGATPGQAALLATVDAFIEAATEKLPLDKLISVAKGKDAVSLVKNVIRQAGIEIGEEEASLIGTLAAEAAILGEKSDFNQTVSALKEAGLTEQEAKKQAWLNIWNEAVQTALVSGISGAAGGLAASGKNWLNQKISQKLEKDFKTLDQTKQDAVEANRARHEQQLSEEANVDTQSNNTDANVETGQKPSKLDEILDVVKPQNREPTQAEAPSKADDIISKTMEDIGLKKPSQEPVQNVDMQVAENYNENRRSQTVQDAIDRLNVGGNSSPDINEIMSIPEIAEAERANEGTPTFDLPNREKIREDGYRQAMQKGSWNGTDYSGEVNHDKRMDIVIGLPGSGKSSVYTERLSQEHKSRVIDTDDFREYIPEYNGSNASVVHEEASKIRNRVFQSAIDNGDNILLSTIGANAKKLEMQIAAYKAEGYQVYLHLNELPNNKSMARAIGRYIGEDGSLGRYVSPKLIAEYGDKPTQTYLYLTSQGGTENGGLGSNLRAGRGRVVEGTGGALQASESTTNHQGLLAGYDWYNNDVARGEAPKLIQTSEQTTQPSAPQVDTPRVSAEGGQSNIEAVGAAEQNFSGKAEYQNLLSDENSQRDRPGDVRPMEVPKTDSYDRHVTEFAGNAYGAAVTPDRMANEIESLVQDGALGFDRRSNKESLENARDYIYGKDGVKGRGEAATRSEITRNIAEGKVKDGDIEKAMLLYAGYANRKSDSSQQNAAELMVDLSTMANMTGRNLQLFKLMRQLTPEGQLYTLETEIRRSVDKMQKSGSVPKGYEVSFDPELQQEYLNAAKDAKNAKTPEARKNAEQSMKDLQNAIYQVSASELPVTMKEKWDTWRYMCMLGNAKTQVRNLAGNAVFKPYKAVKDTMAAGFERVFVSQDQRTKSVLNPLSENDRALLDWAKSDSQSEAVRDALTYSAKLGDDVTADKLSESRRIFNSDQMETIRKAVEWMPAKGDMIFKNDYYKKSLAGFLKARGYTAADIQSGKVDTNVLNEGRTYAIQEAMKATFNDSNALSDFIATNLRYKGDNPVGKVMNIVGEGVIPFRRTPANIIVRFGEYSPVGLAKSMLDLTTKVRTGKMTAATAIDGLCSGLTGTAAMALGGALADGLLGVRIVGSDVSEDEKRRGVQPYSIEWNWGGERHSYTIDWAAPANLPLFVGANIYSAIKNADSDADISKFTAFLNAMGNSLEPMLSLSCLSSFSELFENARYADEGEELYTVLAGIATSYFSQGIPSLARQAYQASQQYKKTTYANSSDPTIRDLQKTAANIPFAGSEFKTDKVNEWGEKEDQGGIFSRVVNSFINPGTHKVIDDSDLEKEITRLNQSQATDIAPDSAAKMVSYTDKSGEFHKDVRLTKEQYDTYATTQGQTAKEIAESIVNSPSYAALTDEQKAKAISEVYSYAKKKAEIATFPDHTGYSETWMKEMPKGKEADYIIRRVTNSSLSSAWSSISEAWSNGYDVTSRSEELNTAYESYSNLGTAQKKAVLEDASGSVRDYVEARDSGVSHDKYLFIEKTIKELKTDNPQKAKNARAVQKAEAVVKTSGLTEKQKEILVKQQVSDSQDKNIDELKALATESEVLRKIYDIDMYTELYRDYEDYTKGTGKKKRTISHWMDEYDIDRATATKLYEIFS